jgi:hypothetical protein
MCEIVFCAGTIQRICLFSDDFYSDSTLILATIAMKQCIDIGARPHVCGVLMFLMFVLTITDALCCAWFIKPTLCWWSRR